MAYDGPEWPEGYGPEPVPIVRAPKPEPLGAVDGRVMAYDEWAKLDAEIPPADDDGPPGDAQGAQDAPAAIDALPFDFGQDPAQIPPRRWLYGRHLLRQFVSVDVAAGGLGKTAVKVGEALAMASGRPLYGVEVHEGPLAVWLYNLEDPADEMRRRIWAAMEFFRLAPADVAGRLFLSTGREMPLVLAVETVTGAQIVAPVRDALRRALLANAIDVLTVDPFVLSHEVSENDNRAMAAVIRAWASIADECGVAVNLVHHIRKGDGNAAGVEAARGGRALTDAARSVVVYNRMDPNEAGLAGVPEAERGFYFRAQNEKANLAPPSAASWFRMREVKLANGDRVGVAAPWDWPEPFAGISVAKAQAVQRAIAEGDYRANSQSPDWAGYAVATACGMDVDDARPRISAMLKTWIANGVLAVVDKPDAKRRPRAFVEVGTWIVDE